MKEKLFKKVQDICGQALKGELYIDELFKIWPQDNQDAFLKVVFEDVEDAVEHLPSSFVTGRIAWEVWKRGDEYKCLLIDNELLNYWKSPSGKLIDCRSLLMNKKLYSEIGMKAAIKNFMQANS